MTTKPIDRRALLTGAAITGAAVAGSTLLAASPAAAAPVGPWEHVAPGASIQAAINAGAKAIQLGAGTYTVTTPIVLQRGVSLRGVGQSTRILANPASGTITEVLKVSGAIDGVYIGDLVVQANSKATNGITLDINGTTGNLLGEPDAVCRIDNVWVYTPLQDGVSYTGLDTQATVTSRVRVRQAGRYGFNIVAPDNVFIACEATTVNPSGSHGFFVNSANCHFHACKAWYTRGYGWHVKGSRNAFVGCESQDTKLHGWFIEYDKNTFNGCMADTAAMFDVGGAANTADGFHVLPASQMTMVGCIAYDRAPSGAAIQQRYGFNIPTGLQTSGCFVGNAAWSNAVGNINLR